MELVSFLIGCSFSFESELLEAGLPVRQIEEGVNVPMYKTNIPCAPADGTEISIQADSVCVHGDSPKALAFVQRIRGALEKAGVKVQAF